MRHLFVLFFICCTFSTMFGQENKIKGLTLQNALDIGLKNHPEIQAAHANISGSKGRYLSGISLPQPEIAYDNQFISPTNGLGNERTISVSQSFEFPSIYFLKGSKYSKAEEITYFQLKLIERNLTTKIKTAYYKVLAKQNQLKTAEENLLITEDFLKKSEIRQNVGEGTNLERLTAKVQFSEAQNNLEISKNELKTAFAELNYTLGFGNQTIDSVYSLQDSLHFVDYSLNTSQFNKIFEINNPQIKIAEINYDISNVEKSLAVSSYLPKINLAYLSQTLDNKSGFHGFNVGVSVPLWFMFEQNGKIQEASANQSISENILQLTKNDISINLKNSITDYENNLRQVKLYLEDILPQSEEIFRTASKSYEVGELTYLEYLKAKQTLNISKNNYNNAIFNYYQSIFKIEEIVGQNITNK
ncbi:MAG: TolC family protein [Candidatus Kapabacteria bacterium]|nr:TolC family protein [Ignavibacteriota bacterium]MCW5884871.1 TolC family protein [Candidatus Kapabacteria bacterium]